MQSANAHAHHPVSTYVATAFWLVAALAFAGTLLRGWAARDLAFGGLLLAVFVTISTGRTYTVKLQDRIIMLEMKVRCAEVLPPGADAKLARLRPKQIVALRFASDDELGALLDRAVAEDLSPRAIKQAVSIWRPDYNRT
ncbi:MAG TPA: DUF6526 family protein [Vicinamibacterales bacterium]|nr:DUF6526 family protein [Vicinamibacterales bacterium]